LHNVRFFESLAVPLERLNNLAGQSERDEFSLGRSQWRIDLPAAADTPEQTVQERQILSVADKILTRGRITIVSAQLEKKLSQLINTDGSQPDNADSASKSSSRIHETYDFWLDSDAERCFYSEFLPSILGPDFRRWVLPQVQLMSLVSKSERSDVSGRADFLICLPQQRPLVIEIDGEHHSNHREADLDRDRLLNRNGYETLRIPAAALGNDRDQTLTSLRHRLASFRVSRDSDPVLSERFELCVKFAHQVQLALLAAIQNGNLDARRSDEFTILSDLTDSGHFTDLQAQGILQSAVSDLWQLLRNLEKLYSTQFVSDKPNCSFTDANAPSTLHLAFFGVGSVQCPNIFAQDISVPFHIANSAFPAKEARLERPDENALRFFLEYIFRKEKFWEGQSETIGRTIEGKDSIVLLPTGAGKSIAFQLASLVLPGRTLVVDPLVSLMDDQIDNLQAVGIDRCIAITSQIDDPEEKAQVLSLLGQGEYFFAYIAPERLQTVGFRQAIRSLTAHTPIAVIAIDEAHCVSEWGHDFRTAYLNIGRICRNYCESNGFTPPLIALTGTASPAVLKDLQRELQITDFDSIITPKSFDRAELSFAVVRSPSVEKNARLIGYLGQMLPGYFNVPNATFFQARGNNTFSGLVFCPHVNGSHGVVEQADKIRTSLGIVADYYSGGPPRNVDRNEWNDRKKATAIAFKQNKTPLLVCTKAFGMGIDKPNIRFTIHFGIPPSIESFYQEAGRAGRDRRRAHCCILVSSDNDTRTRTLLDPNTTPEEIRTILESVSWDENDDVTRALYFQNKGFPGVSTERERIAAFVAGLGDLSKRQSKTITSPDMERNDAEKCIHRLLSLGLVSDYTVDYSSNEFELALTGPDQDTIIEAYGAYVEGYLGSRRDPEIEKARSLMQLPFARFVEEMISLLLIFIYDVIERGRRRALSEMLLAATVDSSDTAIRQRILRYLETTEHAELLQRIIDDPSVGLQVIQGAFNALRSPNDAAQVRGQVARFLESYPDHPGLLMLRSLSEAYSRDANYDVVEQNCLAALSSATEKYGIQGEQFYPFLQWALMQIAKRNLTAVDSIEARLLEQSASREVARAVLTGADRSIALQPALFLIDRILTNIGVTR